MPNENSKEHLLVQAVFAFAQGCGTAKLDDAACRWFHDHYSKWLGKKKNHPQCEGTPHEVWSRHGSEFLECFRRIGQKASAASGGSPIQEKTLQTAATTVETESTCPYCPEPDAG